MSPTDHLTKRLRDDEPELLDADMTAVDIIAVLKRLKFADEQFQRIEIDRAVRDFLVSAVTAMCGK